MAFIQAPPVAVGWLAGRQESSEGNSRPPSTGAETLFTFIMINVKSISVFLREFWLGRLRQVCERATISSGL